MAPHGPVARQGQMERLGGYVRRQVEVGAGGQAPPALQIARHAQPITFELGLHLAIDRKTGAGVTTVGVLQGGGQRAVHVLAPARKL